MDFDLLSVLKPTEGCQWAHVLCATLHDEVEYTNGALMKNVEGVSLVSPERWYTTCDLCLQNDGATAQCKICASNVHPSCGFLAGYRIGFQLTVVKPGKRGDSANLVRFKGETGILTPGIWCKTCDISGLVIHDLFDVDPESGETALQIYTRAYKTILATDAFALLRKAHRLDQLEDSTEWPSWTAMMEDKPPVNGTLPVTEQETKPLVPARRECVSCGISVSPRWHAAGAASKCHQCWFAAAHPPTNGSLVVA